MSLFETFNSTFLISLGLTLLLISILYFYITNKFAEQDHKINSMFSLVSTMAEEQQYFRAKISSTTNIDRAQFAPHMFLNQEQTNDQNNVNHEEELISVSDNNSSIYDDESETSSYYEEDEIEEDDEIKVNNIDMLNLGLINHEHIHLKNDDQEHFDKIEEIMVNMDLETDDTNNEVKTVHLEEPIDIHSEIHELNETSSVTNFSSKPETDYKKMSINKLRELIVEKGIVQDASKLKKNDILKMLGDE